MLRIVWLSFANEVTGENIGVCIVEVPDTGRPETTMVNAIQLAHTLGINPGGHVRAYLFNEGAFDYADEFKYRLMSKEEVYSAGLASRV